MEFIYHTPGKNYNPEQMHLRKSAVVNAHTLAFICLNCSIAVDSSLPGPDGRGGISIHTAMQTLHLWKCLLHSSPTLMGEMRNTEERYQKDKDAIESALLTDGIFPWAALTGLQAPKILSDLLESLLGAIYLDSCGNLDIIRSVLHTLGIWQILQHVMEDDVDVFDPVSRIYRWGQKRGMESKDRIKFDFVRNESAKTITAILLMDAVEECRMEIDYHGHASKKHAMFAVAELAIRKLHLRERDKEARS